MNNLKPCSRRPQIQCAIDEWNSGVNRAVAFTENNYSAIYEKHIRELKEFETKSEADRIVFQIRTGISKHGR